MQQQILRPYVPSVDASHVWGPLWQGSWPGEGARLEADGFDGLALCAMERQPPHGSFPGVRVVVRSRLDDREIDRETWRRAVDTAKAVAGHVERGEARKFLVTCNMGWNRSGLVNAIAIHILSGMRGDRCVELVRRGRGKMALSNESFARAVKRL